MRRLLLVLLVLPVVGSAGSERHFDLLASFEPPEELGGNAAVAVTFRAIDPDLRLNETPAPRLKLDLLETVLVDRQPPAPRRVPDFDPLTAKYVDISEPVRFDVGIAPAVPSGLHTVEAKVVFFYCSVRAAWCRRSVADVDFTVTVP
jgi:hypothetical protein